MNKSVLVVTTSFYPENAIGAVRTTKMIKNLVNEGWDVTVVSPTLPKNIGIDETLYSKEIDLMEKHSVDYSNVFKRILKRERDKLISRKSAGEYLADSTNNPLLLIRRSIYRTGYFFYNIIRNNDWKKQVIKYLNTNMENRQFDLLITTYPSLSSHLTGLELKKNGLIDKWIADFQDPIPYETLNTKFQYSINNYIQKKIIQNCDAYTAVTENLLLKLQSYDFMDKPREYVPMSFDYEDISDESMDIEDKISIEKINISYVGSLYGGKRDFSIIFDAINDLVSQNKLSIKGISVNYAGNEFNVIERIASKYNCTSVLNNLGNIKRKEAIKLQQISDINVIITWNTKKDKGVIPGKLYEAFLAKQKILALVFGDVVDSELDYMIRKSNLGISCEIISGMNEYNNIKRDIADFILDKKNSKENNHTLDENYNIPYVESFEEKAVSIRLLKLMELITMTN